MRFKSLNIYLRRIVTVLICLFITSFSCLAGDYFKKDKLVFDFYSPNWVNTPNEILSDYKKSFGFSFSWGEDVQIKKSLFSIYYGIGYDYNSVTSNAKLLKPSLPFGHPDNFKWSSLSESYDVNKLKLHYLDVPFQFRFKTETNLPFRVYLGTKVGYLFSSNYSKETESNESESRKNLSEINRLRYGITFRMGYGMFNIFSYYGLNNLISTNQDKRINQFSLGLSLLLN